MRRFFLVILTLLFATRLFSFDMRCMHIDLRAQVMTMDALKELATNASKGGINAIMMEWEATFPYQENATICNSEAYSREEVEDFIKHCESLGIDVIPLQNCFGHVEYILRHPRYGHLHESMSDFSQVCPCSIKEAKVVFRSIFKDVVALHHSQYIHIGADETRLLGVCRRCAAKIEKEGKSKLFCDYVTAMCEVAREFGKTPIIWADILTKYPEAASSLPKDLVLLDWNYGWSKNRFGDFEKLASGDLTMWGAPALRSGPDDLACVCWMKHFNNLRDYVSFCRERGFKGIVETSWSTSGQYGYIWNYPSVAVDIQPIRQVYPLSGFTILQQAFCEAASSEEVFEPEKFIRKYCAAKFGFNEEEVQVMWEYFNLEQSVFKYRELKNAGAELEKTLAVQKKLAGLKPKASAKEFEHFRLMLDIRTNFLKWIEFESRYESSAYNADCKAAFANELKPIMKECEALQKRFIKLNTGYLKHPEKAFGEWDYIGSIHNVYQALSN